MVLKRLVWRRISQRLIKQHLAEFPKKRPSG
jgi:hypothetical protein